MVQPVMFTAAPAVMASSSIIKSAADSATDISITINPDELMNRAYPAVPLAEATADHAPFFEITPPDAAVNGLAGNVIVQSNVPEAASFAEAGCAPVRICTVPFENKLALWFAIELR